ncbi:MAG: hypothetical protein J5998_07900 [Clostridia bacterium]|nr:hypothetical protein [Clostridia bacterium]
MKRPLRLLLITALTLLLTAALCGALADTPTHAHYANCDNPGVCAVCGEPYTGTGISHAYNPDTPYESDASYHWRRCIRCGAVINKSEHRAACDNPGVCAECGAVYTGSLVSHTIDWDAPYGSDADYHWRVCTKCGATVDKSEHYANCDNPGVCAVCGAAYTGDDINHSFTWSDYKYDGEYHWHVCTKCGEVINKNKHYANCDNPGVCAACGAPYTGDSVSHSYDSSQPYTSDAKYHWRTCTRCGEAINKSEHRAACDNPGVCEDCGAVYTGDRLSHTIDWDNYKHDETNHWLECTKCGEVINKSEHRAACDNPGVCAECGAAYTGSRVSHTINWDDPYQSDAAYHWRVCAKCGEVVDKGEHYAACDKPGVCAECGAAYTGSRVSHTISWDDPYQSDADYHWRVCKKCGEAVNKNRHIAACDNPDVCMECGAAYAGDQLSHTIDWDNYKYDETHHWRVCTKCGAAVNKSEHRAACDNPGVCVECGASYGGSNVSHSYDDDAPYETDATYHWRVCTKCGRVINKSEHRAACDNPGVCVECGAAYTGGRVSHTINWDEPYQTDATSHWRVCTKCGEAVNKNEHRAACNNPGVCEECGAAYTGGNVSHSYDYDDPYESSPDYHWHTCKRCGAVVNRGRHYALCDNPNVCAVCGAAYTGDNVQHDWESPYQSDAEYHWKVCARCGETFNKDKHHAACDNPGVCAECGAAYTGDRVSHRYDGEQPYQTDANYHWRVCSGCGAIINKSEHNASCDNPGVCRTCGVAYTGGNVSHTFDYDAPYGSDAVYHWRVCSVCGQAAEKDRHYATCDNPGVCAVCGAAYTGDRVDHEWDSPYQSNAEYHWKVCSRCGETFNKDEHYAACDNPGVCAECGAAYAGGNVSHSYDWDTPFEHDETSHWRVCLKCGQQVNKNEHWAWCDNPGVCTECGAAYTGGHVEHDWDSPYQSDGQYHWQVCSRCGEVFNRNQHVAACDNLGVCEECGAAYTGDNMSHSFNWRDYKHDENNHWFVCEKCGEVINKEEHYAACDNPGVCAACGEVYTGDNRSHSFNWRDYKSDENYHWHVCTACGEVVYRSQHYAMCDNPGVCAECGAVGAFRINHVWDSPYGYNETDHWKICISCGEVFDMSEHYAACDNPGVCLECGASVTGARLQHDYDSPLQHDAEHHWRVCVKCGEVFNNNEHSARCTNPGVCYLCGEVYTGEKRTHGYTGVYLSEGMYHWTICPDCGEVCYKELHYVELSNPGVCSQCGAPFNVTGFTYVKTNKYHMMLTIDGAIDTTATGLINDPASPADWYYCVEGVVLTDVTGLVDYDGAWFYVSKGHLDTTFAGIVEYDGGRFLVAAGRILTEVQGLNQDPVTGAWFYYGDGMIQAQYTGLAQYDGAWFYIVEGRLAEDFTGDVGYDGHMFHVENGQMVAQIS